MAESNKVQQNGAAIVDWMIHQACRREVGFRTLCLSSTSSFGVAAGTGPVEIGRSQTIMFKASLGLG